MALTAFAQNFQPEKKSLNVLVILSKGPWEESILKTAAVPDPRLEVTFINESEAALRVPARWPVLMMLRPLIRWVGKLTTRPQIPVCSPSLACLRFSSQSLSALWRYKPILIDEGIGSFNTFQNFKLEARRKFRSKPLQVLALTAFSLVYRSLRLLGARKVTLFRFENKKPVLNDHVADGYRRVFKMGYDSRGDRLKFDRPVVLILTQPLDEVGVCSREDLVDRIENLALNIRRGGRVPILKVHPAEDPSKYRFPGVEQIEYDGVVEEIFAGASDQIAEIQGFSSTGLITGSALYGIRAVRIDFPDSGTNRGVFKGRAQALFAHYTKTEMESKCLKS